MKTTLRHTAVTGIALLALAFVLPAPARASSHMDAPLITLDPSANTADVYAFLHNRESDGAKVLATSLTVYPFEEPGEGPNNFRFDDNVLYEIHVALGADVAAGQATVSYQYRFTTTYKNQNTILQAFLGVIQDVDDANQNLTQRYTVTKVDRRTSTTTELGTGIVPPNNQGIATPFYNVGNNGENVAKPGVSSEPALDKYTLQSLATFTAGSATYRSFAGQREDGFYADIQAVFDLLKFRSGKATFDSQGGFNLHEMALEIPLTELGGDQQVVGVYATTSRMSTRVLTDGPASLGTTNTGPFVQVGRQGNPLFNEGLVALVDKDLYSRTQPTSDAALFDKYARSPELAKLINALVFGGTTTAPEENRTDLVGIFIPDVIKVDLSTAAARLAGNGSTSGTNPDDAGFSRLGIFGGDTLTSTVQAGFGNGTVSGGWPNGRRFGDDVLDIAVTAVISDLRTTPPTIRSAAGIDNVSRNDSVFSKVFPYAGTPHNGRNHDHHNVSIAGGGFANRFRNLSTRGHVQSGDRVLIGGIIVGGNATKEIVVRGIGPSLADKNVPTPLADPVLEIYQGGTKIAENDNWKTGGQTQADIVATGLAPTRDAEAAIRITLSPGVYTMIVRSKDASTGIGLVEAYEVD
ncbi:MAG: DUF4331 domain-containing protein [Chthoniobacterales bacterium]|nr:DUF4331 domain-containing protein [Chthoniobacterales bacterium]